MTSNEDKNVFDHPPTSEEVGELLSKLYENDPSSIYYKRTNVRPKLKMAKVLILSFITLLLSTGLGFLLNLLNANLALTIILPICFIFLMF